MSICSLGVGRGSLKCWRWWKDGHDHDHEHDLESTSAGIVFSDDQDGFFFHREWRRRTGKSEGNKGKNGT